MLDRLSWLVLVGMAARNEVIFLADHEYCAIVTFGEFKRKGPIVVFTGGVGASTPSRFTFSSHVRLGRSYRDSV